MDNALKSMDYAAFVEMAATPRGAAVKLNHAAALSLCRSGWVETKAPLAWLGVFWVALIGLAVTLLFWNWLYAPAWLFPVLVSARKSKQSAIAAVWRELKGQGKMPFEKRAEIYASLAAQDMLFLAPQTGNAPRRDAA
ncbi:MAG: hypothetical protein DELT_00097 [Desulfovibrio sp.]